MRPPLIPPIEDSPQTERPKPPVTVVAGFLGAGKTTWLTHILNKPHGLRVALVVNDVGAVNIDAALLRDALGTPEIATAAETRALTNGCVCCSVRDLLAETVAELAASGEYDHIVVECSGVAEPRPIATLFLRQNEFGRSLADFARLHALVTLIDAAQFLVSWQEQRFAPASSEPETERPVFELMVEQVECADMLIVNKCDLVTPGELSTLTGLLRGLNPRAEIHQTEFGAVEASVWPGPPRFDPRATLSAASWQTALDAAFLQPRRGPSCERIAPSQPTGYAARFGIGHFLYTLREPLSEQRLRSLLENGIPGLLRAKGFFWSCEKPDHIGFLSVAGRAVKMTYLKPWAAAFVERGLAERDALPDTLRSVWVEPHGDRRQELVFIGQHLDEAKIQAALGDCLANELKTDGPT